MSEDLEDSEDSEVSEGLELLRTAHSASVTRTTLDLESRKLVHYDNHSTVAQMF